MKHIWDKKPCHSQQICACIKVADDIKECLEVQLNSTYIDIGMYQWHIKKCQSMLINVN